MGAPNALNAIRIILLILSAASFFPQYRRLLSRRDSLGLAPEYILLNLIVATQQFSLGLFFIVVCDEADMIMHSPPTVGEWLNFAQFTVVWVGHLILFGAYLVYPPSPPGAKPAMFSIYMAFLLISIVPVIFIASLPPSGTDPYGDRSWPGSFYAYGSTMFINPIVTALAIVTYFPQARELKSRSDAGACSVPGLAVQAGVFLVVAIFWPLRMPLPWGVRFSTWYQLVGWATLDNLVFAFVQGVLWCVARRFKGATSEATGETAPLLAA
ncbi:hypothetical protein B0T10DRAFT_295654 [Thelonectria olida]|uniref:Uncharacterized protein n=1 Tax=Thelonectria olida TaxID=1576542 RepID=A0A9P8W8J5_9HYPO|nr:hypothetical protein B0T10DRAFT_295654 [Thelonectria olida]